MRKLILILTLAVFGIGGACTKDAPDYRVAIDLHEDFEGEDVQVLMDGKEVLDQAVQTNHALGLAEDLTRTLKKGRHTLEVTVGHAVSRREVFMLGSDLYIGISYDPKDASVSFLYSATPFSYD